MKTPLFIIIVLVSGAFAGFVHGTINFAIVEPYLDQAIGIENQNLFESGERENTPEFWVEYDGYRTWQKSGQILAGVILGISIGSLFGIVFALSRNSLPGKNDIKKNTGFSWDYVAYNLLYSFPQVSCKPAYCGRWRNSGASCSIVFVFYCNFWIWGNWFLQTVKEI